MSLGRDAWSTKAGLPDVPLEDVGGYGVLPIHREHDPARGVPPQRDPGSPARPRQGQAGELRIHLLRDLPDDPVTHEAAHDEGAPARGR